MYVCLCESVCVSVRVAEKKKSEGESTLVSVHQQVCVHFMYHVVSVCMYEFLACQYEMCVSHVEQGSRPLRPGPCPGSQPRVM